MNRHNLNSKFLFEVAFSNRGVARIFMWGYSTEYKAGGVGYCKYSTVIADMVNDLFSEEKIEVTGGSGFNHLAEQLEEKGIILKEIYSTTTGYVCEMDWSSLTKQTKDNR